MAAHAWAGRRVLSIIRAQLTQRFSASAGRSKSVEEGAGHRDLCQYAMGPAHEVARPFLAAETQAKWVGLIRLARPTRDDG